MFPTIEAELRNDVSPLLQHAERVHTVLAQIIGVEVHMPGPLTFDDLRSAALPRE